MAPKFKFEENEIVLCYTDDSLYDATCIKRQVKGKTVQYLINYCDGNNKCDEWVPGSRVFKINDTNLNKQKELQTAKLKVKKEGEKVSAACKRSGSVLKDIPLKKSRVDEKSETTSNTIRDAPSTSGKGSSGIMGSENPSMKKECTKVEPLLKSENMQHFEIKIKIPDDLKNRLADDYDFFRRQKKFMKLPCKYSVYLILNEFLLQKISSKGITLRDKSAITVVVEGIRDSFIFMLDKHLLYRSERQQYILQKQSGKDMCKVYGVTHLLRMFSVLDRFPVSSPLHENAVELLNEIIRFICRNKQYCQNEQYCRTF